MLGGAGFQNHDARIEVAGSPVDVAGLECGLECIHHGDRPICTFGNCGFTGIHCHARSRASAQEP